jgi:hypothetical protein
MTKTAQDKPHEARQLPAYFTQFVLTLGSGATTWRIVAFVLGVLGFGILANLFFTIAYDANNLSPDRVLRVVAAIVLFFALAYLAALYDLRLARQMRQASPAINEAEIAERHAGLICLLSLQFQPCFIAIKHHCSAQVGGEPLRHCWVLITPEAERQGIYEQLKARVADEARFNLTLHPIYLANETIEVTYREVRDIYALRAVEQQLKPSQIMADLTGGTKTMTAGLVMACRDHGYALEYIRSQFGPDGRRIEDTGTVIKVGVDFVLKR